MDPLTRLVAVAQSLNDAQLALLNEMASAMAVKITSTISPQSDIVVVPFAANLANRLLIHHATSTEPLNKKSFEYALIAASRAAGRSATMLASGTISGADVVVDGVRFSLKTEGAQGIKLDTIHISKRMESAGIRAFTLPQQYVDWLLRRALPSLQSYDRVLMLRVIRSTYRIAPAIFPASLHTQPHVAYQLVEIPYDLLSLMLDLKPISFGPISRSGSTKAEVELPDGSIAFVVNFDGSDEKLTISRLRMNLCIHHATFIVPTLS